MIKAGSYKAIITPPLGICLAGSFSIRRAENILDDLYAHALVIADEDKEIALISIDNCVVADKVLRTEFLPAISQMTKIKKENIILAATHTHQSPYLQDPDDKEALGFTDPSYVEYCIQQTATAVKMAQKRLVPANLSVGRSDNPNHVFNRRLRRKSDNQIIMNWIDPALLVDCVPSGPVDPEMLVAKLDDENGNPIAIIMNYGNHNNIAAGGISADMSGEVKRNLEKLYGPDMTVVFLLGASGNTNCVDHTRVRRKDQFKIEALGLTGTVLQILSRLTPIEVDKINLLSSSLTISERPYSEYDVFEDDTFGPYNEDFFAVYRAEKEAAEGKPLPAHQVDINVLQLGEFVLATNPAELFCEFGLEIKSLSPFEFTMVSELTNGHCGYVPTRQAFKEGGYEVRKNKGGSYLSEEAGDKIVAETQKLFQKLAPKK